MSMSIMSVCGSRGAAAALLLVVMAVAASARAQVVQVDHDALAELLADGVALIDVRTPGEWSQTGVIEGSHQITFFDPNGRYDAADWLRQLGEVVGPDQPLALICASGARTQPVSQFLDQQTDAGTVYNVTDGIRSWISAGRPTVTPGDAAH